MLRSADDFGTLTDMEKIISIPLGSKQTQHLQRIAVRYGLSLQDLAIRILTQVSDEMPEEQLSDYRSPRTLARSLTAAFADAKNRRVSKTL